MWQRSIRAPVVLLVLASGVLVSATVDTGTADPATSSSASRSSIVAPVFLVEARPDRLLLAGTTSSDLHESGLLQLATDHFDAHQTQTNFTPGVILPDHWEPATSRLLYALAATQSAQAVMRDGTVEIRGVTANIDAFANRVEFLREGLLANTAIVTDVLPVNTATSHDALCRRAFAQLFIEPVSFKQSSTEIRTASYGTLDRIVDFAYDCRQSTIAVTGHTDATGNEAWNRHLSLARAQAVAEHLANGGVDPGRLLVTGLGSSQPIADNSTPHGRGRNRRIEFSLH